MHSLLRAPTAILFLAGCSCGSGALVTDASGTDAATMGTDAGLDATIPDDADVHPLMCPAAPLPADPGTAASSFRDCTGGNVGVCDYGEECDWIHYDLLCPEGPCGGDQTGDQRCHRVCDDSACAPVEHCESRPVYVSDTPTRYVPMCLCDGASCVAHQAGTAAGGLEAWRPEMPMPIDLYYHAAAATESELWVSGGLTIRELMPGSATLDLVDRVFRATLAADGSIVGWTQAGTLPEPTYQHGMAVLGGRVFVAGGHVTAGFTAAVYSAPIDADGMLGAWRDEAPLLAPRGWHTLLSDGQRLVVAGGSLSLSYFTEGTDQVWIAEPGAEGVIDAWQSVTAPAPLHYDGGSSFDGARLIAITEGGVIQSVDLASTDRTWRAESSMPRWSPPSSLTPLLPTIRGAAFCDALLYVLVNGVTAIAPLGSNGEVGVWRAGSHVIGVGTGFALAHVPSGRIYVLGGTATTGIARVNGVWSTARD